MSIGFDVYRVTGFKTHGFSIGVWIYIVSFDLEPVKVNWDFSNKVMFARYKDIWLLVSSLSNHCTSNKKMSHSFTYKQIKVTVNFYL